MAVRISKRRILFDCFVYFVILNVLCAPLLIGTQRAQWQHKGHEENESG